MITNRDSATCYRIQPRGLGLSHESETSEGNPSGGLHVFSTIEELLNSDALECSWMHFPDGFEVVTISASCLEGNQDAEGSQIPLAVLCDSQIVSRRFFSGEETCRAALEGIRE